MTGNNSAFDAALENLRLDEILPQKSIYQYTDGFSYGTDAVLLSAFVRPPRHDSVGVEFGTGTGVIPILLAHHKSFLKITAFEIQKDYALLARENISRCGFSDKIGIVCDSLENAREHIKKDVDFVFTNPPYMKMTSGFLNPGEKKLIARHEKYCTIDSVCQSAAGILKNGGSFFAVYRPDRLVDLLCALRKAGLEPKELVTVHSYSLEAPKLILCRAKKAAAPSLVMPKPFVLYDSDGAPTPELERVYSHAEGF